MAHRQKVKNFVDVTESGETRVVIKAEQFSVPCKTEPAHIPVLADNLQESVQLQTLIAAARTLCDNVQTVGTHHRVDGKYLDALRQAIDRF